MDINEILKGVKCAACGKEHKCPIEKVYVEENACRHLTEICKEYNNILVVADENTFKASGEGVLAAIGEKVKGRVVFSGENVLIPDEIAINKVNENLEGIDLIVGIGSGVIQDLSKYTSFFAKIPYVIVATAPSMDGYASSGAAMILKGMKETVSAGLPLAIVADTEVLSNAPMEMIKAGYGDIIGKYSALNDWEISRIINGEYFCQYIYDVTYQMIDETIKCANGILTRDKNAVKSLTEALVVVGIMMSFATNSRPASGSEHHLSHFFEISGIVNSQPYLAHGIDVAYSTIVTADIRSKLLNTSFDKAQYKESSDEYVSNMTRLYGAVSKECFALQERLGTYNRDRVSIYREKEAEIKKILKKMPSGEEISRILSLVGLDFSEYLSVYGKEKICDAVKYAKDLKDRYTVLWINYDLDEGKYEF